MNITLENPGFITKRRSVSGIEECLACFPSYEKERLKLPEYGMDILKELFDDSQQNRLLRYDGKYSYSLEDPKHDYDGVLCISIAPTEVNSHGELTRSGIVSVQGRNKGKVEVAFQKVIKILKKDLQITRENPKKVYTTFAERFEGSLKDEDGIMSD
jgi:hypothetical protein